MRLSIYMQTTCTGSKDGGFALTLRSASQKLALEVWGALHGTVLYGLRSTVAC